ncbi:MAG TPA: hypothetical protein VFN22_12585 [Gemmatimonadales bacterium]|nr:hypothetical protein [Gemmatimonadales bacterium]
MSTRGLGGLFAALLTLCPQTQASAQATATDRWRTINPPSLRITGRTTAKALGEASGAVASLANPGVYWTIGDSGNPPELLATDSAGMLRARITIVGATNVDWESVGLGACGAARCIYIADTGDNRERRASVTIYRIPEPILPGPSGGLRIPAERLTMRYPDHPHDVEATGVLPGGDLLLVTKGRSGAVVAFIVPARSWGLNRTVRATLLDTLPILPHAGTGRLVTGLAVDPTSPRIAIRTYRDIYLFDRDEATGRLTPHQWIQCNILGTEPQGEGIAWDGPGWDFLLISERGFFTSGSVARVSCTPRQ